jgi:hypothetical protein
MNRMLVYNNEFRTLEDLISIVRKFNEDINDEISQGTGEKPKDRFKNEQRYLKPLPNQDVFEDYLNLRPNKRKVTLESMISIEGRKYSVPPQYINKTVFFQIRDDVIYIMDDMHIVICSHMISKQKLNYQKDHYKAIATAAIDNKDTIEKICESNLSMYDRL